MTFKLFVVRCLVVGMLATSWLALHVRVSATQHTNPALIGMIQNKGQWPDHVLFAVRQNGADVWITRSGVVCDQYTVSNGMRTGVITHDIFSNVQFRAESADVVKAADNPIVTFCKAEMLTVCEVYQTVKFQNVVPGVNVSYSIGADNRLVRTIIASDHDALQRVRISTIGAAQNNVLDVTPPTSFVYGAYIGGSQADVMSCVDIMPNTDIVVAGSTTELSFPTTLGAYRNSVKGGIDCFVMRCNAKLQRVLSYTYFGGTTDEMVRALTVDANSNIYICGETNSSDLPTTNSATSRTYKVGLDAFVARFDSSLTKLLTGFYHGGNRDDIARGIAVDDNGTIVIAGSTTSTVNLPNTMPATAALTWTYYPAMGNPEPISIPITSGRTNSGTTDGFVATFTSSGIMQQSRYFGKEGADFFTAVAFDKSGNVYLTGSTTSTNFETVPVANAKWSGRLPYDRTYNGGVSDAFIVKFNQNLTYSQTDGETFSTFLGGNKDEEARSIQVDALGRIYIAGVTTSTNMPAIGTLSTLNAGKKDAFYAQFGSDGGDITGCTYFGGAGNDELISARIVPNSSNILLVGTTESTDFPMEGQGANNERTGATDGFLSVINLGTVAFSTLIGGNQADTVVGAVSDRIGNPFFVMNSTSNDLPIHDSSFQTTAAGHTGYIGKLAFGTLELASPSGGETICAGSSRSISWSCLGMPDTTKFKIEYSVAGSGSWKEVVRSVGGRSYSWKVPVLPNGMYVVRISTIYGHVSELTTPFMISNPPSIVGQPKNASACLGQSVSISVSASGAGVRYQWRKQGVNIAGATDSVYTISSLDANALGRYDCVVSGTCSPSVTSQQVTIAQATKTDITVQPVANTAIDMGKPFSLSVTATGSDLTYQWSKNNVLLPGATSSTYNVASAVKADEGIYTCEVTGGCGKITSSSATVVVQGGTSVDDAEMHNDQVQVVGPQPASIELNILVSLMQGSSVIARFMDLRSECVFAHDAGTLPAGLHSITVPVAGMLSGVYAVDIEIGGTHIRRSVIIQR